MHMDENERHASSLARTLYFYTWDLAISQIARAITSGFDTDVLGSYTRAGVGEEEYFHFSLLFIGYAVNNPLSKEDRMDLYKHEYAHYMAQNMEIPKEYTRQSGLHGSAWKYRCSLIGAAPTPYYKAGEALMKPDYEKTLKNPIHDKTFQFVMYVEENRNTKNKRIASFSIKLEKT